MLIISLELFKICLAGIRCRLDLFSILVHVRDTPLEVVLVDMIAHAYQERHHQLVCWERDTKRIDEATKW